MAPASNVGQTLDYDQWHCPSLRNELQERGLTTGGVKSELIERLVKDDESKLPVRIIFTKENDPDGKKERAQVEAEYKHDIRALAVDRAKIAYLQRQLVEAQNKLREKKDQALAKKKSGNVTAESRVYGYRADAIKFGSKKRAPDARVGQADETSADKISTTSTSLDPPPNKKPKQSQPDTRPQNVLDDVTTTICKPWLFISAKQLEVRGDRTEEILQNYKDYRPEDVLVDRLGYYVVFGMDAEGDADMLACYNYWKPRNNWLFEKKIHFELVLEENDRTESVGEEEG